MASDPIDQLEEYQDSDATKSREEDKKKPTQGELILSIVRGQVNLWHTPDGVPWATVPFAGHQEHHPVRSRQFKNWVDREFYRMEGKSPSANAWQDARGTIEGIARWDGDEHPVFVRVAEHNGAYYIDLANTTWQAVKVNPNGWSIVDDPPVRFRRPGGMLPLPTPKRGGSIEDLRPFINIATEDDWKLLVSWLVMALRPKGPYPVLILQGEQGSAKSTTLRLLRKLTDPASVEMHSTPRNDHDLAISAANSHVYALDNLSGVRPWLSDFICRISTGGGYRVRTLYENDEETLFTFVKPVTINGIDDLAARHDLADRSLILTLPPIPDDKRMTEEEFWSEWTRTEAGIFASLLDAVAVAMKRVGTVHLPTRPRMADFAIWATAAEAAFGWPEYSVVKAYADNRKEAIELGIEADVVAQAIRDLLKDNPDGWEGIAKDLVTTLGRYVSEEVQRSHDWPKSPRAMSNRLTRIATAMRQLGISISRPEERTNRGRPFIIRKKENAGFLSSLASPSSPGGDKGDEQRVSASDERRDESPFGDNAASQSDDTSDERPLCDDRAKAFVTPETRMNKGLQAKSDASDDSDERKRMISSSQEVAAIEEDEAPW